VPRALPEHLTIEPELVDDARFGCATATPSATVTAMLYESSAHGACTKK